jgi:release factor-specific protein-(glutamine-N5) methyltransferase
VSDNASVRWTVRTTLEWTQGHLEAKGVENPRLSAQWLLADATGLSRLELYTNYDLPLVPAQLATLREGIKRRIAGEPLQYILGKAPFRHLELRVRPGVLIPRPETEVLVDCVMEEVRAVALSRSREVRVLDLCTGTGCIALSLLQECSDVYVTATDIDPAAVELAQENARELGLDTGERLTMLEDDLATSLLADEAYHATFDVLVANPPYVLTAELDNLPVEIANYEPRQALDGGSDGLAVFRRIAEEMTPLIRPGGLLACELHEATLEDAARICQDQGYGDIAIRLDLTGRPRFITARPPVLC